MISNTDMLLDNVSLNEQAKQAIQTIDFECMRLSRLVKDMLLLASSDAKTWTLNKSTINIDTLLITLYETYEPVCMKQNLELKLHLSVLEIITVSGDFNSWDAVATKSFWLCSIRSVGANDFFRR